MAYPNVLQLLTSDNERSGSDGTAIHTVCRAVCTLYGNTFVIVCNNILPTLGKASPVAGSYTEYIEYFLAYYLF